MYEYTAPMLNAALPDDPHALKALIGELVGELRARDQALSSLQEQIAHFKLQIAVLRRAQYGQRSERLERHLAQLELRLEELQSAQAEAMAGPGSSKQTPPKRPARRPLPAHLPRETQIVAPAETICPACGGALKRLGEDVTEMLEYGPGFLQSHPSGAPEARLWVLRGNCAGPGTESPDRARPGRPRAARPCAGFQIRRSSASDRLATDSDLIRPPLPIQIGH